MSESEKLVNKESVVTLAAIQFEPRIGRKDDNLRRTLDLIGDAADGGATIVTLPEMCNTGYVFNTRREVFESAERVPDGPTTRAWMDIARERGIYIVAGINELDDDGVRCYNSAVLVGPEGYVGTHRKLNLWGDDKFFFEPGNLGYQVFHTPFGRVAMLICLDMWFFENFRILSLMGADLVCCPTNWVDGVPRDLRTLGPNICLVNASCNRIHIVAADRIGVERGCSFPGMSCIVGPQGWYKAGPASCDREEILLAEVNLMQSRRLNWNGANVVHRDRRTDLYDEMLGSGMPKLPR